MVNGRRRSIQFWLLLLITAAVPLYLGSWMASQFASAYGPLIVRHAIAGDDARVRRLLDSGVGIDERGMMNRTALHWSVIHGHQEVVILLLESGADVNASDHESWTPLHFAVHNNRLQIVEILLLKGADRTRTDRHGQCPADLPSLSDEMARLLDKNLHSDHSQHLDGAASVTDPSTTGASGKTVDSTIPQSRSGESAPTFSPWLVFLVRCLGWVILGFFGAGQLGAFLRGKRNTLGFVIAVSAYALYGMFSSWHESTSVMPPLICLLMVVLLGGQAKTVQKLQLEENEDGFDQLKRK